MADPDLDALLGGLKDLEDVLSAHEARAEGCSSRGARSKPPSAYLRLKSTLLSSHRTEM